MEAFWQHRVTVSLGLIFIPNISLSYVKEHDLTYFSFAVLKYHNHGNIHVRKPHLYHKSREMRVHDDGMNIAGSRLLGKQLRAHILNYEQESGTHACLCKRYMALETLRLAYCDLLPPAKPTPTKPSQTAPPIVAKFSGAYEYEANFIQTIHKNTSVLHPMKTALMIPNLINEDKRNSWWKWWDKTF